MVTCRWRTGSQHVMAAELNFQPHRMLAWGISIPRNSHHMLLAAGQQVQGV